MLHSTASELGRDRENGLIWLPVETNRYSRSFGFGVRIALVSTYSPLAVGGIGQFIHDFGIALNRRGNEVTALYRYEIPEFAADEEYEKAVRSVELRPRQVGGLRTLSLNRKAVGWISSHRQEIDLVHVLNPMPVCAAALRRAHRHGIPVVSTVFAKYPRSPKRLLQILNARAGRIILEESDILVYESANTARDYSSPSGRVILNGIDTGYFRPQLELRSRVRRNLSIDGSRFVALFLGRMDQLKGIYVFVEALEELRKLRTDFSAILVGSIEVQNLQTRLSESRAGSNVTLIGPVSKLDVLQYYSAADVFVLPSYLEGISSALLEAMSCGTPVIATNIGGNKEVVRDGVEGILVEPGKPKEIAAAMTRLLDDKALRQRLGASARLRILDQFSLERMTEEYIGAYHEAGSKHR